MKARILGMPMGLFAMSDLAGLDIGWQAETSKGSSIRELLREAGLRRMRQISDTEILERTVCAMINVAAKILEEGIAQRASDIDTVYLNGYGWPQYRGGPMFYADTVGLATVVERLKAYGEVMGPTFSLSPLLVKNAEAGESFTR